MGKRRVARRVTIIEPCSRVRLDTVPPHEPLWGEHTVEGKVLVCHGDGLTDELWREGEGDWRQLSAA